jgi:ADP-heptose:LPS heptosyltransferase
MAPDVARARAPRKRSGGRRIDLAFTASASNPQVVMGTILFIAPARLEDAVLATGALEAARARAPGAGAIIVCAKEAAGLYRAVPGLAAIHDIPQRPRPGDWLGLWRTLSGARYREIIDARGAPIALALGADARFARKPAAILRHRAEDYAAMMGAAQPLAPKLWIDAAARADADAALPGGAPVLALAPAAADPARVWAAENYAAVARRLASGSGPLAGARVALIAGGANAEAARAIARSLDADGLAAHNLAGGIDVLGAAALFERATLVIGEHSDLMALAAAAGAPTLGLFGPSDERVHGPYGARARSLRGRDYEELMALSRDGAAARTLMADVTVDAVEAAAIEMLRAGGLG